MLDIGGVNILVLNDLLVFFGMVFRWVLNDEKFILYLYVYICGGNF